MMQAKRCKLSGLPLTDETRTIDRIDHTKGYEKGNVCACHVNVNALKNLLENPCKDFDRSVYLRALKQTIKHLETMSV